MKFELKTQFRIESSRFLPHLPEAHPCHRMHGHSFLITLRLIGTQHPVTGWVRDYHEIELTLRPLKDQLDHRILNEVPGLSNPTSENLAKWIFEHASPLLPELIQVTVSETSTTECTYPVL